MGGHGGSSGYSKGGAQIGVNASLTGSAGPAGSEIGVNAGVTNAVSEVPSKADLKAMSGGKPDINPTQFTKADWQSHYDAQNPNQDQKKAAYDYTYPYAGPSGFSPSQDMNYKLDKGMKLTPKEQNMYDGMTAMASPLGHDSILHRGAHAGALEQLGIGDWNGMSESQLKQALVGAQWQKKSLTSTSYDFDHSPFLGDGPAAGGREVIFRIHAAGSTKATCVNPSQTEVVLGPNTHWQITNAAFTGQTAQPQATWPKKWKQIVIDVDVWQ